VDFQKKTARVDFDESVISAAKVAQEISDTPHMMGKGLEYAGSLLLNVEGLKDEAAAKKAQEALSKAGGVVKVTADPKKQTVAVTFGSKGTVTSKQLIQALMKVGLKATTEGPSQGGSKKTSSANDTREYQGIETKEDRLAGRNTEDELLDDEGSAGHSRICVCPWCAPVAGPPSRPNDGRCCR